MAWEEGERVRWTERGRAVTEVDRLLHADDLVTVGAFRLGLDHPDFEDAGPISRPIFVFPRTSCIIEHEDRPAFATDTTTVTFYNKGQSYIRHPNHPDGDKCDWFSLREDVLRALVEEWDPGVQDRADRVFPFAWTRSDPGTYAVQRALVRHLRDHGDPDVLRVQGLVLTLLERLASCAPWPSRRSDGEPAGETSELIARVVCKVLRESFRRSCSLDDIARRIGLSVYHMCREFRKATGTTIHRYRSQLRLREALELVADNNTDLTEIALCLGYSSHSHFSASFRKTFQVTPSDSRRGASAERIDSMSRALFPSYRGPTDLPGSLGVISPAPAGG